MKVRCINNEGVVDNRGNYLLTIGKDYEVTSQTREYYRITNDAGEVAAGYFRWRFKEVAEV